MIKLSFQLRYKYVKLATVVKGDPKDPFLKVTTPSCSGGRYSFLWIAPLYPWSVPHIGEEASSSLFWVLGMIQPSTESWCPEFWGILYPQGNSCKFVCLEKYSGWWVDTVEFCWMYFFSKWFRHVKCFDSLLLNS